MLGDTYKNNLHIFSCIEPVWIFNRINQLIRVGQENGTRINLYSVINNISINLRRRSSVG